MSENKYPYIGEHVSAPVINLFTRKGFAIRMHPDNSVDGKERPCAGEGLYNNRTHNYLSNTCGEVKSKEHAEFIVKLAEVNNIKVNRTYNKGDYFCFHKDISGDPFLGFYEENTARDKDEKKITIPLPPKKCAAEFEEREDWPCVGSKVTWGNKSASGEVIAISEGLAWIKNEYGNHCTEYVSALLKPKTPDELLQDEIEADLSDLIMRARDAEVDDVILAKSIMSKYKMQRNKKPQ